MSVTDFKLLCETGAPSRPGCHLPCLLCPGLVASAWYILVRRWTLWLPFGQKASIVPGDRSVGNQYIYEDGLCGLHLVFDSLPNMPIIFFD